MKSRHYKKHVQKGMRLRDWTEKGLFKKARWEEGYSDSRAVGPTSPVAWVHFVTVSVVNAVVVSVWMFIAFCFS